ncbi:MAG: site-2 protease family protein [Acidimicrobiales bacterium]
MGKSVKIGRIAGTPISVNGGLAVLAALFVVTLALQGFPQIDPTASLNRRLVLASSTVLAFLISILAHELGHASLAKRQGVGVMGITLSLLGGYAQLDRQAPTPRAEFLIAAAGPATNLLIGAGLGGVTYLLSRYGLGDDLTIGAMIWLAGVNIVLAVLNLFPAAPLDGGRVLTAALWKRLGDAEHARILSGRVGLLLGLVLAIVGAVQFYRGGWPGSGVPGSGLQGLITLVVAVFLFNGARGEISTAAIRRRLQRTTAAQLMISDPPPVSDSLTLEQLSSFAGDGRGGVAFPVVRWGAEPIGYVLASAGASLSPFDRSRRTVYELMRPTPDVARAWLSEPIDTVLDRLSTSEAMLVVVHEPSGGRVVGTLSETQVNPLFATPDLWGRDRRPGEQRRIGPGRNRSREESAEPAGSTR